MHRTLKAETARPPKRDMAAQQRRVRRLAGRVQRRPPHDALGGAVPADRYVPSPRPMPDVLPEPDYPGHFEVRYVSRDGAIRLKKRQVFVSQALGGEHVGLEEDGRRGLGAVLLRPAAGSDRRAGLQAEGVTGRRRLSPISPV